MLRIIIYCPLPHSHAQGMMGHPGKQGQKGDQGAKGVIGAKGHPGVPGAPGERVRQRQCGFETILTSCVMLCTLLSGRSRPAWTQRNAGSRGSKGKIVSLKFAATLTKCDRGCGMCNVIDVLKGLNNG